MAVLSMIVGAVTSSGASFVIKVDSPGPVGVAVADNPEMDDAVHFGPVQVDLQGVGKVVVTGLSPNVRYWWQAEDEGMLDTENTGQFKTHPEVGQPASFTFASASCSGGEASVETIGDVLRPTRVSNHPVHELIRERAVEEDWLFFAHMGDMHYYDLHNAGFFQSNVPTYRRAYDDVLLQPNQAGLYRDVPLVYTWDDHDYSNNDSNGTHIDKANVQQVYRERFPHYPLPGAGPIYHSFQIGRILFMVSDTRSERSPNNDPDNSSKTMFGTAQKQWMKQTLQSSNAEYFVWLLSSQWMGISADSFDRFQTERQEFIQMFTETGWIDRMCIVSGDMHALAIDTGSTSPGGIPVFQFAALDSEPSSSVGGTYDLGISSGRNRYGTIEVSDNGADLKITGTGWIGSTIFASHTIVVSEAPPPPPAFETLPSGTEDPVVHWLGVDFVTGRIVADLPAITGDISRQLGDFTGSTLSLPIPRAGQGSFPSDVVFRATEPGRTMIVAVVNDEPAWGGRVLKQVGGSDGTLNLSCSTTESYLRRRIVRNHEWTNQDVVSVIAAGVAGDAGPRNIPGLGLAGGIGLEIDAPSSGITATHSYTDIDKASVYQRLQELMSQENGPEWTIELLWGDSSQTWVRKVLRIRPRIGVASSNPSAVFTTTGESASAYEYDRDYGMEYAATWVETYSTGEGEDQPRSDPAIAVDRIAAGWPIDEMHEQSDDEATISMLNSHASAILGRVKFGARTFAIRSKWFAKPRLNIDWRMGDDISCELQSYRHPEGIRLSGRCIGWELSAETGIVQPVLLQAG